LASVLYVADPSLEYTLAIASPSGVFETTSTAASCPISAYGLASSNPNRSMIGCGGAAHRRVSELMKVAGTKNLLNTQDTKEELAKCLPRTVTMLPPVDGRRTMSVDSTSGAGLTAN